MVYLSNANEFQKWCAESFEAYKARNRLDSDQSKWQEVAESLQDLPKQDFPKAVVDAWAKTIFAEFSLYGAEGYVAEKLSRFDAKTRQEIWGAFTVPDDSTFLARIDTELIRSKDPAAMARKYPWIQDG